MKDLLAYCRLPSHSQGYAQHRRSLKRPSGDPAETRNRGLDAAPLVDIIAYCIMPTHFHLAVRQVSESGISAFMKRIKDSYSKFFNILRKRKGPLWESRYQSRHVRTNEDLLNLSLYIHFNPVKAKLVGHPRQWEHSSFNEYTAGSSVKDKLCGARGLIPASSAHYLKITEAREFHCERFSGIGHLMLDGDGP